MKNFTGIGSILPGQVDYLIFSSSSARNVGEKNGELQPPKNFVLTVSYCA